MSVINETAARTRDQVKGNLHVAETVALALVDVVESAVSLAVPVALAAVPDRSRWLARADQVVESTFSASRDAISSAYASATQAVEAFASRVAA